jgi:hypothetical protein
MEMLGGDTTEPALLTSFSLQALKKENTSMVNKQKYSLALLPIVTLDISVAS